MLGQAARGKLPVCRGTIQRVWLCDGAPPRWPIWRSTNECSLAALHREGGGTIVAIAALLFTAVLVLPPISARAQTWTGPGTDYNTAANWIIIDADGDMFVDLGSATNSCQVQNRIANSPGHQPCTELETRAGTWLYDANKKDQRFSPLERYATGLRNGEGFGFDSAGRLFVTQHGRDQLSQNWPKFFTSEQSAQLPAEEIVQFEKGADYGWPECYYDGIANKLLLAPEYGVPPSRLREQSWAADAQRPAPTSPMSVPMRARSRFP
jgi:hypothetical protein